MCMYVHTSVYDNIQTNDRVTITDSKSNKKEMHPAIKSWLCC